MKRSRKKTRAGKHGNSFHYEMAEPRLMLTAVDLLPDLFAWESESRGFLHDYYIEGNLLRFTTALANSGDGPLEIRGGEITEDDRQIVYQRIYRDDGTFWDREAGEFTYHPGHGHIHFDGYATYNLRANVDGEVGDIVASGGKVSFCLIDITRYDPNAGPSEYGSCGATRQGISAGWSDVYGAGLPDQWINITGIDDGEYFLEIIVDPDDQLLESDETNNVTVIPVSIVGGPGAQGDRHEPNNSFDSASMFGLTSNRHEAGLSIHTENDVDYYQIQAVEDGEFDLHIDFTHDLGNLDLYVYDGDRNLIGSSTSNDDLEEFHWDVLAGEQFYFLVQGVDGATNAYEIGLFGPGDITTVTISAEDTPIDIPDGSGGGSPGPTVTSVISAPDFTISDLNLIFNDLTHTWLGDLNITLTSPAGTTATILSSTWENGGGLLGSEDNFYETIIDDQATINIGNGSAPFTGSYNNEHANNDPLSVFNGENALGDWSLAITDWYTADTGSLNAWSLMLTGIDNNTGDIFEQNDDFPQATDFETIGLIEHSDLSIHKSTDVDFYRFKAQDNAPMILEVNFLHEQGNLDVIVYDSNQQEIARGDTINDNERLVFDVLADELYYVQVYGVEQATNDYQLRFDAPEAIGESGIVDVKRRWVTVDFGREFENPVVIVSPATNESVPPTLFDLRIQQDRFQIRLQKFPFDADGVLTNLTATYMIIEAGTYQLSDGTILQAGRSFANSMSPQTVGLGSEFTTAPVVFAQRAGVRVLTYDAVTTRVSNVTSTEFDVQLQRHEASTQNRIIANIHWLAIEPGSGTNYQSNLEAGITGADVTDQWYDLQYAQPYANPILLAATQTTNELDPFVVRTGAVGNSSTQVYLHEEQSQDSEQTHAGEVLGYLVFERGDLFGHQLSSSGLRDGGDADQADPASPVEPGLESWQVFVRNPIVENESEPSKPKIGLPRDIAFGDLADKFLNGAQETTFVILSCNGYSLESVDVSPRTSSDVADDIFDADLIKSRLRG